MAKRTQYYSEAATKGQVRGTGRAQSPGRREVPKAGVELRNGLDEDEIEELREAFNLFDTDGSKVINPKDLADAMAAIGFDQKNPTMYNAVASLAGSGNDKIDFEQFLDAMVGTLGDKDTQFGIERIFNLCDKDGTGAITLNNLQAVAKELGETMTVDELREMVERSAADG